MSYFDDASLVMIPSGYKTSKVYSVKPTDGTGDLTFTRSNDTATRVASNGLIEKVRTNVILQSETFDNASWSKSATGTGVAPVVTANNTTAPDGTLTADKIVFSAPLTADRSALTQIISLSTAANGSIYLKAFAAGDVGKIVAFRFNQSTYALITLTADWQRFNANQTADTSFDLELRPSVGTSDGTVSLYAWGAQLETGDIATPYIATTTAAVSVGPVANVPRLDYLNSSCPRLLLEPQRTNLRLNSENFSAAAGWSASVNGDATATFTANYGISPDGYQNADRVQLALNTTGSYSDWINYNAITIGTTYTYSVYAKSLSGTKTLEFLGGTPTGNILKTITTEWTRLTHTFTAASGDLYPRFLIQAATTSTSADILVWGAQLEAGAYATSYIPTLGAAVTRGADACSKTGISSLIGQTEGTLYAEYNIDGLNISARIISVSDSTTANRIVLLNDGASIRVFVANSSVGQVDMSFGTWLGSHKIAVAYANNDLVVFLDGVSVATDTSISVPACSAAQVGTFEDNTNATPLGGGVKQALLFKTRLTNAQLAELTA